MAQLQRRTFSAMLVWVWLTLAARSLAAVPTEGLIHWWPDPAEGTDQVTGRRGVRRGFGPTEENPEVRFGYAAGWVELGPGITNRTFTISGWRREPLYHPKEQTFDILSQDSGLGDGWALRPRGTSMQFVLQPALNPNPGQDVVNVPTRWQAFAVRAMANEVECWFDGVRSVVWPVNWPHSNDTGPLCVGNCAIGNTPWDGDLRDLRIYDRVLKEAEIQALAGSTRSEPTPSPTESATIRMRTVAVEIANSSEYSIRRFTTDDGLPDDGIQCLLPRKEGALWLGTKEGVTSFDGRQFVMPDAATAAFRTTGTDVRAITEGRFDTWWVGTFNGLIRHRHEEWQAYTNIGPARLIRCLVPAADGTIWLVGNRDPAPRGRAQLRRFDPDSGRLLVDTAVPGQVHNLQLAPDGVWIATEEPSAVWHFHEARGTLQLVAHLAGTAPPSNDVSYRLVPQMRALLGAGIPKVHAEVWQDSTGSFQWAQVRVGTNGPTWTWTRLPTTDWQIVKTSSDCSITEWVPMTAGVLHRDGERWERWNLGSPVGEAKVIALAPTLGGGIWAAAKGDGLWLVRPHLVRVLPSEQGWATAEPKSLQRMHDGRLLVGGLQHAMARIDPRAITPPEIYPRQIGGLVAEDSDGRVVRIAKNTGAIAFHLESGDLVGWCIFRDGNGLEVVFLEASQIHVSKDGGVWIITETGVYHTPKVPQAPSNGSVIYLEPSDYSVLLNQLPKTVQLHGLAEASDGALWIGSTGAGLFRIFKGQVENFPDSALPADSPCVPVGFSTDGTLWLGSEDGLGIFREGRYQWVRRTNGLPESVVSDVEEAEGHVWFAGRRGVHAIRRDVLEEFFAGKRSQVSAFSLGRSDGLASTATQLKFQPAMAKTDDGQLWVATARGVAHFHPRKVLERLRPPMVTIASIKANAHLVAPGPRGFTLPPGSGRVIEAAYSCMSLDAPERLRFQYHLTGPDCDIHDESIQPYAVFPQLGPGQYVLAVQARSGNGLVSDPPARLEFTIEPHFYETSAFYLAVGLAALLAVAGLVAVRVRFAERRGAQEQERRLVAERTRIAQDMHDNLGSGLARLAWKNGYAGAAAPEELGNHSQHMARELLRSLDEAVWAINPTKDHLEGVVNYLGSWVRDYFADAPLALVLDLPASVPDRPVPAQWRHHVLMMVREICANALKHARASRMDISVRLEADPGVLNIQLRDDGVGIPLEPDDASPRPGSTDPRGKLGGNGIRNLRDRATALNARLRIVSQPGSGTDITIAIPLPEGGPLPRS